MKHPQDDISDVDKLFVVGWGLCSLCHDRIIINLVPEMVNGFAWIAGKGCDLVSF